MRSGMWATASRCSRSLRPGCRRHKGARRQPQPDRVGGLPPDQWVKPFVKKSGCTVHVKYGSTSDEMVALMRSSGGDQYDLVSASGDASLRLIYGKDVQPVDPSKVPDFKNFGKAFQSPPNNTVDGKHYGISVQWGPNSSSTTRRR